MIKRSSPRSDAAWGTGRAASCWKWPRLITAAIASLGLSGPASATEAQYKCSGGERPAARFVSASGAQGGSVTLIFDAGREITLPQVMSADGGRYAGNGVEFWIKGRSATLTRNGVSETCSAQ